MMEKELGEPVMLIFQDQNKLSSIRVMSILIWAGLLKEEKLTLDEVIDLIPVEKLKENLLIVVKALGVSLGVEEKTINKEMGKLEKKTKTKA